MLFQLSSLFGAHTVVLFFLVRGLYRLLFNRTWSNDGLAHITIFVYSPRVMSLLVFDAVFLFLGYFWVILGLRTVRWLQETVYYFCRLPCT